LTDQWPGETYTTTNTLGNTVMTWAQNGRRNCTLSVSLSEDGLAKNILLQFPTTGDRDNWLIDLRAEDAWTQSTAAMRTLNTTDNGLSIWFGNEEDDDGSHSGFLNE
jgi:hypothetical protein